MMLQALTKIWKKGRGRDSDVLGVEISPEGVAIARLAGATGDLNAFDFQSCAPGDWPICLDALVDYHKLAGADCYVSLHSAFYNMLLVDAPDVNDAELSDAVRWRVKDLISQSLDDVVVEVFRLPPEAYRGRMNMVYASIVERNVVKSIIEVVAEADLNLQSIGINDLSVCQYGKGLSGVRDVGLAFVTLGQQGGVINLTENGLLYLSRSIDIGLEGLSVGTVVGELALDAGSRTDALALDIQRSLDYYESQLGKSGIGKVIFMPTADMLTQVVEDLRGKVSADLQILDLTTEFSVAEEKSGVLNACFNAMAVAMSGLEAQGAHRVKGGGRGTLLAAG